jgi:hypothetical protein
VQPPTITPPRVLQLTLSEVEVQQLMTELGSISGSNTGIYTLYNNLKYAPLKESK